MPKIEMSKKYQTISGKSVRIISVDVRSEDMPVVGLIDEGTYESVKTFTKNGKYIGFGTESGMDLIEVKPRIKQTFWFNIYKDPQHTCRHMSKKDADKWKSSERLACVKVEIDCEEGEGLP